MQRTNIDQAVKIYQLTCDLLMAAIAGIPEQDLRWQPAPESRSIAEICRHLIRVESWHLQQMGFGAAAADPGKNELSPIQDALHQSAKHIVGLVRAARDDAALLQEHKGPEAKRGFSLDYAVKHILTDSVSRLLKDRFSLDYAVKHIAQHNLYHAAQIIYLRRARDRAWPAPLSLWEKAVHTISEATWKD